MKRLFHLVPGAAWQQHIAAGCGAWTPAGFASEGFVHLSYAPQLAGTLDLHFAAHASASLLEIDPAGIGAALKLERSRGAALFPHLYRPIEAREVLATWELLKRGELWQLPSFD